MKNTKIEVRDGNGRFIVVDEQYFLDAGKAEGLLKQLQDKIREEPYEI
jgi:hypothetical protein